MILAGGQSRRLGTDKAFLSVDGQPLVARTLESLAPLSDDRLIVTNTPEAFEGLNLLARLIRDERPGVGSLMGIYSGLKAACYANALVVACDMPFLSLPLLRFMIPLAAGYDVVIPRIGGLAEPLHAIYSRTCLAPMARLLDKGQRKIIAFFHEVRVRYVEEAEIDLLDPHHLSFLNVNTVEDWRSAKKLLDR